VTVTVVMPTYNESGNIGPMIRELRRQFDRWPEPCRLLVVDDESPDGTGEIVRAAAAEGPAVQLLTGPRRGLGAAYVRGMTHALERMSADVVVEMDADFSHDPADLPRLLAPLRDGADFVIGSRYVAGGTIPRAWSPWRRAISRCGNDVTRRFVAGCSGIADCTSGFRAIRAPVLLGIPLGSLRVEGYAFQAALLARAVRSGAIVREIPIHFRDRARGTTKLGLRDLLEFARMVLRGGG